MAVNKRGQSARRTSMTGFTLLEVLVAILIIALGLLGLAGLQARIQQAEFESYQRSQALVLLYDMIDRMQINHATITCFAITNDLATGTPYYGEGSAALPSCAFSNAANNAIADTSMVEWDNMLKGTTEQKGGVQPVGAMVGARGCASYDATTELLDGTGAVIPGTGIYTVAVAWQGTVDTFAPTVACANNLYGPETRRRVVSATLRIASLP